MKHSPTGFVSLVRPEEENLPVNTDANPERPARSIWSGTPVWLFGIPLLCIIRRWERGQAVHFLQNPPLCAPNLPVRGSTVNQRTGG